MAKKVNVELKMTPFIGLFALLVCMLLVTAVWNHVSALSTNSQNSTASSDPSPPPQKKKVQLSVTILKSFIEMAEDAKGKKIRHKTTLNIDKDQLVAALGQWRIKYPDRKDVILNTENGVTYNMLVETFDTLVGAGWHDVGVSTQ